MPEDATSSPLPGRIGHRASLERKLPILISALLLAVVAVYEWVTYDEVRRTAITATTEHMRVIVRQLADISQASTSQRFATLRRLAADSLVVAAVSASPPAAGGARGARADSALGALLPPVDSTREAWELLSADGEPRQTLGKPASAADRAALRRLVPDETPDDSVRVTPFYAVGTRSLSWTVVPVTASGRTVGYLAERRRMGNAATGESRIRQLTGQNVTVLFTTRDAESWTALNGRPVAAPFALRDVGETFAARGPDGERLYGAQSAVRGTPYVIVVGVPESAVLSRPRTFLRETLGTGAAVLLVGAAGAWLLSRRVTRPLRTLATAAGAIAGGDYRQRVALNRRDELGTLGDTFNLMAHRIGESHDELARRVEQSTALAAELEGRNADLRAAQEATLRAVRRTQQLQSVTAALAGALEFERVVSVIVDEGVRAAGATSGELFVVDSDGTTLTLAPAGDGAQDSVGPRSVSLDAPTPLAEAVRGGQPVLVRESGAPEAGEGAVALAALPLVARGRTIGALRLHFAPGAAFDAETPPFLRALAQQCAQALDRALLYGAAVHARYAAEDARRAAQRASEAKSDFLAMMSHELRTPLNAIGGYTELLELGIRGPITDAQREDFLRIRRNQQHLLSIIEDLLNLSRIEAGKVVVEAVDVPVPALLAELDALVAPQVAAKGLRYVIRNCDDALAVRADPEKLRQALLNLVSNAVRFTDAGGAVTVECSADDRFAHVRVIDTGQGIPRDKLDAIFEPFVQVDTGLTRRAGGTGLGLAISRDLVAAMGGHIAVTSEIGVGSTFTLSIPRAAVPSAVPHAAGASA